MLELPTGLFPSSFIVEPVDMGFFQQSAAAMTTRIDRPGNHYRVSFELPWIKPDLARVVMRRLESGRSQGLRIKLPLVHGAQGNPGSPVVNGTDSGGTTLKLSGLTAGYAVKEGYWLNLIGSDGTRYLHKVCDLVLASGAGAAVLTVEPPLRIFPGNGDAVQLAAPVIEGFVTAINQFDHPVSRLFKLGFTIAEAA